MRRPLHVLLPRHICTIRLRQRTYHAHHDNDCGEHAVRHVDRLAVTTLAGGVPALPVLPRCIVGGAAGLVAPGAVDVPERRGAMVASPAEAVNIVESSFFRVAEQIVGGDEEAVALESGCLGYGGK